MKKKSQLTLFLLLGIVVLFIFIFLYWAAQSFSTAQMEKQIDQVVLDIMKSGALEYYVNLCLRDSANDAIELMGRQGGVIYKHQNGTVELTSVQHLQYDNYNVSYGTQKLSVLGHPGFPPPPMYPLDKAFLFDQFGNTFPWFYGDKVLPFLCQPGGPNDVIPTNYTPRPCISGQYGPNSIQEQLANYTRIMLPQCVNLSFLEGLSGYNINASKPNVSVIIGDGNIVIDATFPLVIGIGDYEAIRKFDFRTFLPVRLKRVYAFLDFLLRFDNTLIDFNISNDFTLSPQWDAEIGVKKFCPYCPGLSHTDILKIVDSASKVHGKDFIFTTAMENRIPALDYIHETGVEPVLPYFEQGYGITIDLVVVENSTILFEPRGYDPDEDNLTYRYTGWREDYYEDFDESCCCVINPATEDCAFPTLGTFNCKTDPTMCMSRIDNPTHNWTESDEFKQTNRSASYKTNASDVGVHNVTIWVYDEEGLRDWQTVWILITKEPSAEPDGSNEYGMQTNISSIEDRFILDAGAGGVLSFADKYTWVDSVPDFGFDTTESMFLLPSQLPTYFPEPIDILNIMNYGFKTAGPNPSDPMLIHNLALTVTSGSAEDTETYNIEVYKCLPYDHPTRNAPPFPYHNLSSPTDPTYIYDPFFADHVCCSDGSGGVAWGYYYDQNTKCFNTTYYGSYLSFDINKLKDLYPPESPFAYTFNYAPVPSIDDGSANDIYKRDFKRYCTGDRGNICGGSVTDVISVETQCLDEIEYGKDERCRGPPAQYWTAGSETTTKPSCARYNPGQTFEKIFGDGTGICNSEGKRTSAPGSGNYGDGIGNFNCTAMCEDGWCDYAFNCNCGFGDESCKGFTYQDLITLAPQDLCVSGGICNSSCNLVGYDDSDLSCRFCGSTDWSFDDYSLFYWEEPGVKTIPSCCGDDLDEHLARFTNISGSKFACCESPFEDDCVDPDTGECVDSGATSANGRWYCDSGIMVLCDQSRICDYLSSGGSTGFVCNSTKQWQGIFASSHIETLCAGNCGYCNTTNGVDYYCEPRNSKCSGCSYCGTTLSNCTADWTQCTDSGGTSCAINPSNPLNFICT